jgi:hypothetical protein
MAKITLGASLDLNKNELIKAVVQTLNSHPTDSPSEGQIYYNSVDKTIYVNIDGGSTWLDLGDIYDHPNFTALTPDLNTNKASVLASLQTNDEGHVIAASTRIMTLADLGYTGATDANKYIHPTDGVDFGPATTGATIISDVEVNAEGHVTGFATRDITPSDIGAAVINDSVTNLVNTWSSQKIQDKIDVINNTISGALVYKGVYNASTNSPNLDSTPSGVETGFTYVVSVGGNFYTESVQPGDMLIAETNNPTTLDDWSVINKNIPDIVDATTSEKGILKLATQAMVNAGTDNTTAVTPLTLKNLLDARITAESYAGDLGDGTTLSYIINHGLGDEDVHVSLREKVTKAMWLTEVVHTDTNNVTIKFNVAPTANQFRVKISK